MKRNPLLTWDPSTWRHHLLFCGKQLGAFGLGLLFGGTQFDGGNGPFQAAAPFALALVSAGEMRFLAAELLGVTVGCILHQTWPANLTIMGTCAVATLCSFAFQRFGFRRTVAAPIYAFVCSLLSCAAVISMTQTKGILPWLFALCGAVLAGCSAYFILRTRTIHVEPRTETTPQRLHVGRQDCAALLLLGGMGLCALGSFSVGPFVPARFLAVLFVLASACCFREFGGAVAGCSAGMALSLTGGEPAFAAVFTAGGLLAGAFSGSLRVQPTPEGAAPFRRSSLNWISVIPIAGGFALACVFFASLQSDTKLDPTDTVVFLVECTFALLCSLAVPAKYWNRFRQCFADTDNELQRITPPETEAVVKLSQTAAALRQVGHYLSEVSEGLEKIQLPAEQTLSAMIDERVCAHCLERQYCQQEHAAQTLRWIRNAVSVLKSGQDLEPELLAKLRVESGLPLPCRKPDKQREALLRAFDRDTFRRSHLLTESQLRSTAAAQFDTASELIEEIGNQMSLPKCYDAETAERAQRVFTEHGYQTSAVSCVRSCGADAPLCLSAAVHPKEHHSSRTTLTRAITQATGLSFTLPLSEPLSAQDDTALLTFTQQPTYRLETGAVQMSSSRSNYCGDTFELFPDGRGREILILSDGMGTGGRAAVDSTLATESFTALIQAGLSFSGAARITNQILLLKSSEETLATLDAVGISLYTGEAVFCKAGGAASYLKLNGTVQRLELSALPAGILKTIHPAEEQIQLHSGDLVILVSDGVLGDDDAWLMEQLAHWTSHDMQSLAEQIAAEAILQRGDTREDDMTILCAALQPLVS